MDTGEITFAKTSVEQSLLQFFERILVGNPGRTVSPCTRQIWLHIQPETPLARRVNVLEPLGQAVHGIVVCRDGFIRLDDTQPEPDVFNTPCGLVWCASQHGGPGQPSGRLNLAEPGVFAIDSGALRVLPVCLVHNGIPLIVQIPHDLISHPGSVEG